MNARLSRRQLLAQASGIVVTFALASSTRPADSAGLPGSLQTNRRLDGWVAIDAKGNATIFTGKVEIGQGIVTALAQIAAEELDLPLSRVTMVSGDTDRTPNEGQTSGSYSIERGGSAVRYACAEVRGLLLEVAAQRLTVAPDRLTTRDGLVFAPGGRSIGYGDLAGSVNLRREATARVAPKNPDRYSVVGRPVPRLDIPGKVRGEPSFIQDVRVPGMLHGRIVRPPRPGMKLQGYDAATLSSGLGLVQVVRDGSFLGVIGEQEYGTVKLRQQLIAAARWNEEQPMPPADTLHQHLRGLPAQRAVVSERTAALPPTARPLSASYRRPFIAHASIGPSCALALYENQKLTVWTHSQGVFPLRASLATVFGLAPAAVQCIHVQGSGCYGHNGADDVALDAALLARAVPGRPVRVQWMRDDEFGWEPYSPAMSIDLQGALLDGRIVDWRHELYTTTHGTRPTESGGVNLWAAWNLAKPFAAVPSRIGPNPPGSGDRNAIPLYQFPRQQVVYHLLDDTPIRTSALRTLGAAANIWAIESFIDELALLAEADPIAFRLAHLQDARARAVIEAAARLAGWQHSPLRGATPTTGSDGQLHGRGIGFAQYKNEQTYVAVIADVAVNAASGAVQVTRMHAAADAGLVINSDGLRNQIEGGIIQATSWTLKESVQFDANGIRSRNWATYPILRMTEVPRVEVAIIEHRDLPALGAGEASCGPASAAIANAFARATGVRLRELPLSAQRVKTALG